MKTYLGDAVYCEIDEATAEVILTTEDGVSATNRIVLEPEVMAAFMLYTASATALRPIFNAHLLRAARKDDEG